MIIVSMTMRHAPCIGCGPDKQWSFTRTRRSLQQLVKSMPCVSKLIKTSLLSSDTPSIKQAHVAGRNAGGRECPWQKMCVCVCWRGRPDTPLFLIHTHLHKHMHSTQMIGVKYPSVRELGWTNDSPCCLLELHDNSILLAKKEKWGRV